MKITYEVKEKDLLTLLLFNESTSERTKKNRNRSKFTVPIFYIFIAIFGFFNVGNGFALMFLLIAVLWLLFYPLRERKRYVRHFTNYINETLVERLGNIQALELDENYLFVVEDEMESKIPVSKISGINEIPSAIIVNIKGGSGLAIPKDQIQEIEELKTYLRNWVAPFDIKYNVNDEWKWK